MKSKIDSKNIRKGATIVYNDGRGPASAVVLAVKKSSMLVQFEDRADTTTIRFNDSAWVDFITLATQSQSEFFSRADVQALQAVQKSNPFGSEAHKAAFDEMKRLASLVGADSFFGDYQ